MSDNTIQDGLQALSNVSGLPRAEVKSIFSEVKANLAALEACPKHQFEDVTPEELLRKKFRCTRCGGTIGRQEYNWYQRGLKDA